MQNPQITTRQLHYVILHKGGPGNNSPRISRADGMFQVILKIQQGPVYNAQDRAYMQQIIHALFQHMILYLYTTL